MVRRHMICVLVTLFIAVPVSATPVLRVQMALNSAQTKYMNEQIIPAFERDHDVDVQFEMVNWTNRQDKLLVATAAGLPPDVFLNGSEHILELVQNNLITPLDKELGSWSEMKDFYPPTLGSSTLWGHRYGVPFYTAPRAWWYRTDLFEESGLDAKTPPTTWDGLLQAARKITRKDGNKVIRQGYDLSRTYGNAIASIQDFTVYLWQNGGQLVDPNTFEAKFSEPAGQETIKWLFDLLNAVRAPGESVDNGTGTGSAFFKGRAGIHLGGGWIPTEIYKLDPSVADVTKAILPLPGKVKQVGVTFTAWLSINSSSQNKELAWQFIKAVTAAKPLYDLNAIAGTQSPRRSTVMESVNTQPLVRYLYETLNYSQEFSVYLRSTESTNIFGKLYAEAMSSKIAPSAALDEAARQWNIIAREAAKK